ncbi:MAG: glycoside hydrolase family 25 protein, partial [Clostridia bacterium]|nr:glycoside hydrolase family 25 protein [Clostridia bacterium]
VLSAIALYHMVWNGVILLNNPSKRKYPVRGVDVSHYQGEIDWNVLSGENIDFAFIKATEGSSFVDDRFAYNFAEAQKCNIAVGAYHFFSFSSSGLTQAENFISTVSPFEGMLPPVVDLEFYGEFAETPLSKESVDKELRTMLDTLEEYYGLKPIIYATEESYELYLANDYEEYDIWIRNVKTKAKMSDGRQWTFWQYTNRERLDGYNGQEKFIDMNVFFGSEEEFAAYPRYISR